MPRHPLPRIFNFQRGQRRCCAPLTVSLPRPRAMAGESRFCQCPVCGVHIALLLAAQHVDGCLRSAVPSPAAALQAPPPSFTSQCAEAVSAVAKPESEDGWGRHEHRQAASGQDRASGGSAWGSLKPPTSRDVRGPRRSRKAFDVPPQPFEYLVVLDYECCLLYTSPSPRDVEESRMPSSA